MVGIEPETPALLVRRSTNELSRPISTVLIALTTTFLPLQSFFPLRNTQQTKVHPVRNYYINKYLLKAGHSTKCSRKKRKYRNKQYFIWKKKMYDRMKNTEMIFEK